MDPEAFSVGEVQLRGWDNGSKREQLVKGEAKLAGLGDAMPCGSLGILDISLHQMGFS